MIMTKHRLVLFLLFSFALCAYGVDRETRDPWHGSKLGDWIIKESVDRVDAEEHVRRMKIVRTDLIGERICLSIYAEENGAFQEKALKHDVHVLGTVPEEVPGIQLLNTSSEVLIIDGAEYPCEVEEYEMSNEAKGVRLHFKVWSNPSVEIPYRELQTVGPDIAMLPNTLRLEFTMTSPRGSQEAWMQVASFDAVEEVEGKPIQCVYEEGAVTHTAGAQSLEGTVKRWLNKSIPGQMVKIESEAQNGDSMMFHSEEIIAYGKSDP